MFMFLLCICFWFLFFFKQKTAYEMRISDWSSDVCSSDLVVAVSVPCICGSDTFAMVTVIAYSVVTSVSVVRIIARVNAEGPGTAKIGRASCRERVCQYV